MNRANLRKSTAVVFILLVFQSSLIFAKKPEEWDGINFLERQLNYTENSELSLMPDFEQSEMIREELKDFEPSGSVELLYRMPKPDSGSDDLMLYLLNSLGRISTMEGIEYYSGSRKRMYLYLEEAAVVKERKSEKEVDDPYFASLPEKPEEFTIYQKDTTFGKIWYNVSLDVTGQAIRLSMINSTTIRYKMFPVLRKERLRTEIIVIPRENDLLFYGLASFKLGHTFGIELKLDESFDHRVSALQVWFSRQVYK